MSVEHSLEAACERVARFGFGLPVETRPWRQPPGLDPLVEHEARAKVHGELLAEAIRAGVNEARGPAPSTPRVADIEAEGLRTLVLRVCGIRTHRDDVHISARMFWNDDSMGICRAPDSRTVRATVDALIASGELRLYPLDQTVRRAVPHAAGDPSCPRDVWAPCRCFEEPATDPEPPTPRSAAPVDPYVEQVESRPLASRALDPLILTDEETRLLVAFRKLKEGARRYTVHESGDVHDPEQPPPLGDTSEKCRGQVTPVRRTLRVSIEQAAELRPHMRGLPVEFDWVVAGKERSIPSHGPTSGQPMPDVHVAVSPEAIDEALAWPADVAETWGNPPCEKHYHLCPDGRCTCPRRGTSEVDDSVCSAHGEVA